MRWLFFLCLLLLVVSLFTGSVWVKPFSVEGMKFLLNVRLPRVLLAFSEGMALGVSGALYQMVLRNPLADGFTTGAASFCALGAVVAIAVGFPFFAVAVVSFVFGIIGVVLVFKLSSRDGIVEPVTMVLAGIVLNIVASSVIGLIKFLFEESLFSVVYWLMGAIYVLDWWKVVLFTLVVVFLVIFTVHRSYSLNLLALDDYSAAALGADVSSLRREGFLVATLLVALSVSVSGIIAFVGLMVPHMVRWFAGADAERVLYYSALGGGLLLLLADTLSRTFTIKGAELPVGVVTSFLGGGFFLYLLFVRKRGDLFV